MIALDPQQTFDVMLDIEAGKPDDQRTKIKCRFGTRKTRIEYERLVDEANNASAQGPEGVVKKLDEAIKLYAFDAVEMAKLETMTLLECWEVANKIPIRASLEESERKKSALQSASAAAAASAQPAPKAAV